MGSHLRNGFIGALMATTATVGATPALAVNAEDLGLSASQNLYMRGAGVLITEKCVPKNGDVVCNMMITHIGHSRYQTATVTYTGAVQELTGISVSTNPAEFYSYNSNPGIGINEEVDTVIKAFERDRKTQPFEAGTYKTVEGNLTSIEDVMQGNNIFATGGKYRPLDGVVRVKSEGQGVSEVSCKLIPVTGTTGNPFDIGLPESHRAICVKQEYNQFGAEFLVKTTVSIHTGIGSAVIRDSKQMGDAPNGEISRMDHKKLKHLKETLGSNPTAFVIK